MTGLLDLPVLNRGLSRRISISPISPQIANPADILNIRFPASLMPAPEDRTLIIFSLTQSSSILGDFCYFLNENQSSNYILSGISFPKSILDSCREIEIFLAQFLWQGLFLPILKIR